MHSEERPSLFGIKKSNKDFSKRENWGKNQFNNCFPVALAAYMHHRGLQPRYITLDENLKVKHSFLPFADVFGISPDSDNIFFSFESDYSPYRRFVLDNLPRIDLVTQDLLHNSNCLRGIEIKLTALPDNTTCELTEDEYSCEIVTRPDTIVYIALSIASIYEEIREKLLDCFLDLRRIEDWTDITAVLPLVVKMIDGIDASLVTAISHQTPLVMQPIWKTEGKSPRLNKNCLDIFVWSSFAFTRLFVDVTKKNLDVRSINRPMRSVIWLAKMLFDFAQTGKVDYRRIIDEMSFNTKNDRAFAASGSITYPYLKSDILLHPRVEREEIKHIILGGGEKFLSPERRFDAVLLNTIGIFQ